MRGEGTLGHSPRPEVALRSIAAYSGLRLIAAYCGLLRLVAAYCDSPRGRLEETRLLLPIAAHCCSLLLIAAHCGLLRQVPSLRSR